jgi:iron(III) transport system ATP-binding protein
MTRLMSPHISRGPVGVSFAASLAFENISHKFDNGSFSLNSVSLKAQSGEVLCLLGPSGSGKTTLLRIAAGIDLQSSGRILLNDEEISGPHIYTTPEKRSIGLVFQDYALFPHMSIVDNVRFGLTAMAKKDALLEAMTALGRVGLQKYAHSYPHELSGGEQQRVALARALVPRPAVLLMDEPFSGLDSRLKDSVRAEALSILRQSRATTILVTHDSEEAMRMADKIVLMNKGSIVQAGTAHEIYTRPNSLFVAGFFSQIDVFEGVAKNKRVETSIGTFATHYPDFTPISVAVRVGNIEIGSEHANIEARILSRRFLGESELIQLALPNSETSVFTKIRCGTLEPTLRDIRVFVRPEQALVFEKINETV